MLQDRKTVSDSTFDECVSQVLCISFFIVFFVGGFVVCGMRAGAVTLNVVNSVHFWE